MTREAMAGNVQQRVFAALWTGADIVRGRPDRGYLRALEASQYLDRQALAALQWEKLGRMLRHAYDTVPFYRSRFDAGGLRPESIASWEDFRRIPELTRRDLQRHLTELISTHAGPGLRKTATGGSTGVPAECYHDDRYRAYWKAGWRRAQRWYGLERGAKVAYLKGTDGGRSQWSWRQRVESTVQRRKFLNAFHMTAQRLDEFAATLEAWRPDFLIGYPTVLHAFAKHLARRNRRLIRPRAIQSGTERLWDFQRTDIEGAFGCPVIDTYGTRETAPIAAECLRRDGLHVMSDLRLVEILDDAGRPAPPGTMGRVVVTDLTNYAMPLVRYDTDDLASWRENDVCPCGRTLPLLGAMEGRSSDIIRTKAGMRIHGFYFMHIIYGLGARARGIEQYQVRQTSLERLEILIQPNADYRADTAAELRAQIDAHTASAFEIEFRLVDAIPTTRAGKHRFTISDLAPE